MLLATLALALALLGTPASAQWVQCVARSPSGSLFVGEPAAGAEPGQGARYRAEFIKAGRSAGGSEAEVAGDTAFCFTAASQADLARLVAQAGKPCATCQAPYTPKPVAWNIRDVLPLELAANASHLMTLVMSEPPPPPPPAPAPDPNAPPSDPAGPPAEAAPPPPPPPPRPLASARWRTLMCGTEVRVAYALETPADSPLTTAPLRAQAVSPHGGVADIDVVLDKAAAVAPSCKSTAFVKVADIAEFSEGLPPRGDERLAALKQRLEDVTLMPAPPPPPPEPPPTVVATTPAAAPAVSPAPQKSTPAQAKSGVVKAAIPPPPPPPPPAAPAVKPPSPPVMKASASPPAPPAPPVAEPEVATQALNAEINRKNAEVEARNAAATAAYEKRMAEFKAAQESYERAQKAHEAELAKAAEARAAWEAKVKACNAGDRAACQ